MPKTQIIRFPFYQIDREGNITQDTLTIESSISGNGLAQVELLNHNGHYARVPVSRLLMEQYDTSGIEIFDNLQICYRDNNVTNIAIDNLFVKPYKDVVSEIMDVPYRGVTFNSAKKRFRVSMRNDEGKKRTVFMDRSALVCAEKYDQLITEKFEKENKENGTDLKPITNKRLGLL